MFFKPEKWEKTGGRVNLTKNAEFTGITGYAADLLRGTASRFGTGEGTFAFSARVTPGIAAEGYEIELKSGSVAIRHADARGLIYAAATVKRMAECGGLECGILRDSPACSFRGYKVYLPGRAAFADFFKTVDIVAGLKYNCIFFEIGGAMEYKRHPEINASWKAFADDTHRYSGRTAEIQQGYAWHKDSIHTDNGEGDILTQDEVKMLAGYCRYRGLDVYPEVPSLSHTDYICLAHPEIAERKEDPYPDTYCPSNPKSYELLFDILDEVIGVFEPKLINIGHDEVYSFGLCEKCRGKAPDELFTGDVTKIHDYLASKGVKTAMWCDKLFPAVTDSGYALGGSAHDVPDVDGITVGYPALYQCQAKLPRDILMMNWYYGFGLEYDFILHRFGYPAIFANMSVPAVKRWRLRVDEGMLGGTVSNWGSLREEYMQRNCQYANLAMGAYAMWSRDYDSGRLEELSQLAFEECYRLHFGDLKDCIEVTHATDRLVPYKVFYDGVFIDDGACHMGRYVAAYDDGSKAEFEVRYGSNILCSTPEPNLHPEWSEQPRYEVCYSAVPVEDEGRLWFKTAFRNPYPGKKLVSFTYVADTDGEVRFKNVTVH